MNYKRLFWWFIAGWVAAFIQFYLIGNAGWLVIVGVWLIGYNVHQRVRPVGTE